MDPITHSIEHAAFEKLPSYLESHSEGVPFSLQDILGGTPVWENSYRKHAPAGRVFYNRIEESGGCILDGWHIKPSRGGRIQMYIAERVDSENSKGGNL